MSGPVAYIRRLLLLAAVLVLLPLVAHGQGVRKDDILLSAQGYPIGGAAIGVCQAAGLATTAAVVSNNQAILTMASNPITAGFVQGAPITVTGFSGADAYFNGSFVLSSVGSTTISYPLAAPNASASTSGIPAYREAKITFQPGSWVFIT